MGFEESPLVQQFKVLDKMRELDLINEQAYQDAKNQIQVKSTASYMEGMLGGFASLVDENSKTYAVLFAAQKAFAVAQALLNIPQAYSKAFDAVVGTPFIGPYIAPAIGAAAAALQVAQAAQVKSVSMKGYATGGLITGAGTGTSDSIPIWASDQEFMMKASATKSIGVDNLNYMNQTGKLPNDGLTVIINNHSNEKISTNIGNDGKMYVTVGEVNNMIDQSWGALNSPNSKQSKAIQNNFQVARAR